jgi:hypothetical protein
MVYILGVDHWLQEYNLVAPCEHLSGEPSKDELIYRRQSKGRFYEIVESLIPKHGFSLLGEECKRGQDTIPRRLADKTGMEYLEIDMAPTEREADGIDKEYERSDDTRSAGYKMRERHMFNKISAALSINCHALIICGAVHLGGLVRLFQAGGMRVLSEDISKEEWVENPIKRGYRLGWYQK